jgi:hypothetical protein
MPDHDEMKYSYCSMPQVPERTFDASVTPGRARLIQMLGNKWANGTVLHYYFFDKAADGERVFFSNGTNEWRRRKRRTDRPPGTRSVRRPLPATNC